MCAFNKSLIYTLIVNGFLLYAPSAFAQTPTTDGLLSAREFNIVGCGFPNAASVFCTLPATSFFPAAANIEYVINGGIRCRLFGTINLSSTTASGTPNCTTAAPDFVPLPTAGTTALLNDIFTGIDANGFPDLPSGTGTDPYNVPNGTSSTVSCTTTRFVAQDAGGSNLPCGNQSTSVDAADWAIIEGWVIMPPTPSGQIIFRNNNVGADSTPRENYINLWVSSDDSPANLQMQGEVQTEFGVGNESNIDFTVATTVGSANSALTCSSAIRYVRLYYFDNYVGGSASITWSLDGGATFAEIPVNNISSNNPSCLDYGDAPQSYDGTATAAARHTLSSNLYLGTVQADDDGVPPPWAPALGLPDGDDTDAEGDDEDGVDTSSSEPVNDNETQVVLV